MLIDQKIDKWKNKLLDMGKRNRLLNYKEAKVASLKIVRPDYNELFNSLVNQNNTVSFYNSDLENSQLNILNSENNENTKEKQFKPSEVQLKKGEILTNKDSKELTKSLYQLRSRARTSIEEQGINILYLAFGFMEWTEIEFSKDKIVSPLVLVPVELSVESILDPYKLTATDDDVVLNPVLEQKLEMDFGITLPELPEDNDLNIIIYIKNISDLVKKSGWTVNNEVHLSLFSFLKLSMYEDLDNNTDKILEHPVIKAICGNTSELMPIPEDFKNEFDIDQKLKPLDSFQILDADSSQQKAIIAAKEGLSFVLQGPPGTGKSQTIANIIAQSIADGKKVLFVSEKMAALKVVYKRLKNSGLEDFCLELHSYKANKKDVISELGRTLRQIKTKANGEGFNKLDTLLIDREKLNEYDRSLHTICKPLEKSIYQIHGEVIKYSFAPNLSFEFKNPGEVTQNDIRNYNRILEQFSHCMDKMGKDYKSNPWYKCNVPVFTLELQHNIMVHFGTLQEDLKKIIECINEIREQLKVPEINNIDDIKWLVDILDLLKVCPKPPKDWFKVNDIKPLLEDVNKYFATINEYKNIKNEIDSIYNPEIYSINIEDIINQINNIATQINLYFTKEYIKSPNELITKREEINKLINNVDKYTNNLLHSSNEMAQIIGINCPNDLSDITKLIKISNLISKDPKPDKGWFTNGNIDIVKEIIINAKSIYFKLNSEMQQLVNVFDKEILNLDVYAYLKKFRIDYSSLLRYVKPNYYKDRKIINTFVKVLNKKISNEDIVRYLQIAKDIKDNQEYINNNASKWKEYLGNWFNYEYTKWDELLSSQQVTEQIIKLFSSEVVPEKLINLLVNSGNKISEYKEKYYNLEQLLNESNTTYNDIYDKILIKNNEGVFNKDIYKTQLTLFNDWQDKVRKYILPIYNIYDKISSTFKERFNRELDKVSNDLNKIKLIKKVEKNIESSNDSLKKSYGYFYSGLNTEWQTIAFALNWTSKLINRFLNKNMSEEFIDLICSSSNVCKKSNQEQIKISNILNEVIKEVNYVEGVFDKDAHNFYQDNINDTLSWVTTCNNSLMLLQDWIDFRTCRDKCAAYGLNNFINEVLLKKLDSNQVIGAFYKRFYRLWLDCMYSKFPCLQSFRSHIHEDTIEEFKELDKLQFKIAQSRIKERLSSKRPDPYGITFAGSETSILMREVEKRRRNMPIRKLFKKIPNLLPTLKPCLLMSPLSVSLYLDPNLYKFDLVIFDEASQVYSEDAIGAIYRGKQLIVVGDREQLPPTNFFNANISDDNYNEEDEDDTDDYESILDECGGVLNKFSLLWHYRSRSEDLITFSNAKIYKNLITFPSPKQEEADFGVQFIYVKDGCYDRSLSRTNKIEAKKVTEIVFDQIRKHPDRSLGVITFSQAQQQIIDDEIRFVRENNPKYESFFDENNDEPFFIKNLENVQGDERDTIIFSVGYAKDQNGILHMNFGPLSKQGGYRRLNVAITRAKFNIKLVSSIKPTDIDLEKTNSAGVKMLRSYLEYAIEGPNSILSEITLSQNSDFESPFEEEVYKILISNGYDVDIQVGCSGYRIDMAVKHPKLSGCYTLGIECDGATYHSARTARERDRLREEVLQLRGWNIYRIWSTDWIKDERNQVKKLLQAVDNSIKNYNKNSSNQEVLFTDSDNENDNDDNIISFDEEVDQNIITKQSYNEYQIADISCIKRNETQDDYSYVASIIKYVVSIESPIHFELLAKRLTLIFGQERVSNQIRKYLRYVIKNYCNDEIISKGYYYWAKDMVIPTIRICKKGDKPRPIGYICDEEISELMKSIIKESIGINKENLILQTGRVLGYNRIGMQIKERLNNVLDNLLNKEIINIVNDNIAITQES